MVKNRDGHIKGSAIAFVAHRMSRSAISFALGLSAGVMIYISFVELSAESQRILSALYDEKIGVGLATLSLFGGIAFIWIIDFIIPEYENPHEIREVSNKSIDANPKGAKRLGLMTALAIAIHNFPEGVSTFVTAIIFGVIVGMAIMALTLIYMA